MQNLNVQNMHNILKKIQNWCFPSIIHTMIISKYHLFNFGIQLKINGPYNRHRLCQ